MGAVVLPTHLPGGFACRGEGMYGEQFASSSLAPLERRISPIMSGECVGVLVERLGPFFFCWVLYKHKKMYARATLYAKVGCPFCEKARDLLHSQGVPFTEIFPTTEERKRLTTRFSYSFLPVILMHHQNGKFRAILGSDSLVKLFSRKKK